jgi:hypothetical protein
MKQNPRLRERRDVIEPDKKLSVIVTIGYALAIFDSNLMG